MRNVLADLAVESEAATISALRLARAYDEAHAGDEQATVPAARQRRCSSTGSASAAPSHAVEALECLGGNGYVEESGMPRLYRETPAGLDLGGLGQRPVPGRAAGDGARPRRRVEAFFGEVDEARGADARLDSAVAGLARASSSTSRHREQGPHGWSSGWRWSLQGSLLVRYGDQAVADAFCASRLDGDCGPSLRHPARRESTTSASSSATARAV